MKKEDKAGHVTGIILTGSEKPAALCQSAQSVGIEVHTWKEVMDAGKNGMPPAYIEPTQDDVYIFSYTSGTTGDSKGVKISHKNVLSNSSCYTTRFPEINNVPDATIISYLPYTHSFE